MSCFAGISLLNKCEITALTVVLSLALSEGLDTDDLNALGNLLATVGSFLNTYGSLQPDEQKDCVQKDQDNCCY